MHGSRPHSRRRLAVVSTVIVLLVLLTVDPSLVAPHSAEEMDMKGPDDVKLVSVSEESDVKLWPFTSRQQSFESLTLPINAVVRGESSRVITQLSGHGDKELEPMTNDWQGIGDESEPVVVNGGDIRWRDTTGATRYTYIAAPGPAGGWMTETAQLHDGTYFGSRHHLRLYEGGSEGARWTAIQAHHEHWDWFRLRHTVGSLSIAQHHLETEYLGASYTADISRERFANGGASDADGWASVIDLRPLSTVGMLSAGLLLFGSIQGRNNWQTTVEQVSEGFSDEVHQRSALLLVSLLSLPLIVRSASILAETTVPNVPVKLVAGMGYLVFAVGIPVVTILFSHGGEPFDWAGIAILGLGLGFVLDYQSIGIEVLPIAVVLHRLVVLGVIGFVAASASNQTVENPWSQSTKVGLVMWVCVLAWPLFIGL